MKRNSLQSAALALVCAGMLALASCTNEQTTSPTAAPPRAQSSVTTQPGVAGGVVQDVFIVQAVVSAIDVPTRRLTLTGSDGVAHAFTASPEIRNLAQVKVGDKVTTTFSRRIAIIVRDPGAAQPAAYTATAARAALGDRPGALLAEETEITATVRSIDAATRTAVLGYADGTELKVPVRQDVELSRYKAGDQVVTRITRALTVLVAAP